MFKNPLIMKKSKVYLLLAVFTVIGFGMGLAFDSLFTKSYADDRNTDAILPSENVMEVTATGTARSADYEIVYVYGKKYIIFSSGSDIEVLEYNN